MSFLTRIEVHHSSNYEPLHREMNARGFVRYITSGDGDVYKLPPGTYQRGNGRNASEICDLARAAARAGGYGTPAVIVAHATEIAWNSLELASAYEKALFLVAA